MGQIASLCFVGTFTFDRQIPITLCQFIGVMTCERVSVLGMPEIAPADSALVQPMVDLDLKQDRGDLSSPTHTRWRVSIAGPEQGRRRRIT